MPVNPMPVNGYGMRQQVLLADDDNDWPDERSKRQYLNDVRRR